MRTISLSPKFSLPLCYVPSCKMRYSHVGRWLEEQPLLNMSRSSSHRKFLVKGSVTTCFMCLNLPCCFVLNILPLTEIDLIVGYPSIVLEKLFMLYLYHILRYYLRYTSCKKLLQLQNTAIFHIANVDVY